MSYRNTLMHLFVFSYQTEECIVCCNLVGTVCGGRPCVRAAGRTREARSMHCGDQAWDCSHACSAGLFSLFIVSGLSYAFCGVLQCDACVALFCVDESGCKYAAQLHNNMQIHYLFLSVVCRLHCVWRCMMLIPASVLPQST